MAKNEWLLFTAQLPATPSSLRVNIWRRLREAGSVSLQNGLWILPRNAENTIFTERLLAYVKQNNASGQIFLVQGLNPPIDEDIIARFAADRHQEFEEFLEQCKGFIAELDKETQNQKYTFAELEENEQNLGRLRKWLVRIQKRDFFTTTKSQEAMAAFQNCRQTLQGYTRQVYTREGIEAPQDEDFLSKDGGLGGQEKADDYE